MSSYLRNLLFKRTHLNIGQRGSELAACGARSAHKFTTTHDAVSCKRCRYLILNYPNLTGPDPIIPTPPAEPAHPESTTP